MYLFIMSMPESIIYAHYLLKLAELRNRRSTVADSPMQPSSSTYILLTSFFVLFLLRGLEEGVVVVLSATMAPSATVVPKPSSSPTGIPRIQPHAT